MQTLLDISQLLFWIAKLNIHPIITDICNRIGFYLRCWHIVPSLRPKGTWTYTIDLCFSDKTTRIYVGLRPNDEFFISTKAN